MIIGIDHDVFRLQVPVHDAFAMDIFEGIADSQRDTNGAVNGQLFLFDQDLPQQPPIHPFHDHVHAAAIIVGVYLHHARMIELLANLFFALEAIVEKRIGFHFRMGNFDGYGTPALQVGGAINRGHTAPGDEVFQAVMIELGTGVE